MDENNWYLNSYASRHICNKRDSFSKLCSESYRFLTADRDIIISEKVGMI